VLYTNPRGSQSYGQEFALACVEDWGGSDFADIMAGLDHLVDSGVADAGRLGVTGWSYGGYMTCWTVTQTDRFKAAIAGACVSNRYSLYGTSDIGWNFGHHHFGAAPWEDAGKVLERSPINFADRVKTPILLLHGESDLRCPLEQSEQFYQALRSLNREAVLVTYPGESHSIRKPQHVRDRFARMLAWFEHHLRGETPVSEK